VNDSLTVETTVNGRPVVLQVNISDKSFCTLLTLSLYRSGTPLDKCVSR
jgi:hypothetical protein